MHSIAAAKAKIGKAALNLFILFLIVVFGFALVEVVLKCFTIWCHV
ncbi:MAG: hypothetical protein PHD41_02195 [Methanosarcinaceae archaeon]|nr:hypothetical protein [Methanosarcinaceae archaeon]MDD4332351.1 hypothetical protein [Methanosarcinaceae archaeon]MDD4749242.1 hypothetical protein [Methanosarcinaceae archaeon]